MTNTNITATPEEKTDSRLMAVEKFSDKVINLLSQDKVSTLTVRNLLDKEHFGFRSAAVLCTREPDWRIAELILQTLERTYRATHAYMVSVNKDSAVSERAKDTVHAHLAIAAPAAEGVFTRRQHYAKKHHNFVEKMTVESRAPMEPTASANPPRMPAKQLEFF